MKTPTLALAFCFSLATLLTLTACKEKPFEPKGPEPAAKGAQGDAHANEAHLSPQAVKRHGIKVEPVASHLLVPTLLAPARVSFNTEAMAHVGSPLRGRATDLKVRLGDTVKKGDVLLVIESPELGEAQTDFLQKRSAAKSAQPAVDLARSAHDRAKALYDKSQGIALTEVHKREADLRAAQAALLGSQTAANGAENKLHLLGMNQSGVETLAATGEVAPHFSITAPIAGTVVEREVTLGELVSPEKEALLILADLQTLWVLADVPEAKLADVAVGANVQVMVGTGSGVAFNGLVAFISPAVDPTTRSAQVRIEVRESPVTLRPGMFARVEIESKADGADKPVLAIPDEAVQTIEGATVVFVPVAGEPNTFVKRPVKVGRAVGGLVPVLSGLKEGESVVIAGSFILKAELGKGSLSEE